MKRLLIYIFIICISATTFAQNKYDVVLPEKYNKTKAYPLFIALHGGHGNMVDMKSYWTSDKLATDFIVVYMEASTLDRAPNRFGWRDLTTERENIKRYYTEIVQSFEIKKDEVYIGGFSLGAKTSIDITLGNIIPINGFILLNLGGGLSDNCTAENVKQAKSRGVKGVVMLGDLDHKYKPQTLQLNRLLDAEGFPYKLIENKNTGHTTPNNFKEVLDESLLYLLH